MRYLARIVAVLVLITGVLVTAASAQIISGDVVGNVTDPQNALIPNAQVHAVNVQTNVAYDTVTNDKGEYRFTNLPAGHYDITATAAGFGSVKTENFEVQLNKVSSDNFQLRASTSTSVEVTAQAAVALDQTTSQLQNTFEIKELTDLPTASGNILNLSLLAPGVTSAGGTGIGVGPAIGGQRPQNNDFELEGVDNNNKTNSGNQVNVPNDAVQEFTLLTNNYSAEYGHSNGGHFNAVVISGTNSFHGKLYEYFQNRNLNAIDFQTAKGCTPGAPCKNPRFDDNRFGGQLGGPVLRDRLFFFANYEREPIGLTGGQFTLCVPTAVGITALNGIAGISQTNLQQFEKYVPVATNRDDTTAQACGATAGGGTNNPVTTVNGVPVQLGVISINSPAFQNNDKFVGSGDWTISQKDGLRLRYIYNLKDGSDTTNSAAQLRPFQGTLPTRFHLVTLSEFHTFSPNLTNEFRVGYNRNFALADAVFPAPFPGLGTFPNLTFANDLGGLQIGPNSNFPQGGVQNLYQLVDSISWLKGPHTLKFGFDGRKFISPQSFTQRVRGDYVYSTLELYLNDKVPDGTAERSATATGAIPKDYGDATALAGFVQDDWKIRPNLTLNLGVRYEFQSVPIVSRLQALNNAVSVPGLIVFKEPKPQYLNFGPRLGFNFAPDNNTSIRGGFTLAYDQIRDNLAENSAPPDVAVTIDADVNTPPNNFLANGALPAKASFATLDLRRKATSSFTQDQKVPYAEAYTLGVQRVFHQNYTAEIRYTGTHGVHLVTQDHPNRQPTVTASFHLPTFFTPPSAATIAGLTTTLAQIQAANAAGASVVPAYLAAGFPLNITSYDSKGGSNYNGLSGQITRRFVDGLLLNVAYTWSKTMDNSTSDVNSIALTPRRPQDFQNFGADYSRSALDHTHRLTAVAIYDVPFFKHSNFLVRNIIGNWEIAPTYTYESPEYVTILSGDKAILNGETSAAIDRTIVNPAGIGNTGTLVTPVMNANGDTVAYVANNPTARYVQAAPGALPNAARNTVPGEPINNVDMTVVKRVNFTERYAFEFQAQAFNVLNHPQYIPGSLNTVAAFAFGTPAAGTFNTVTSGSFLNSKANFSSEPRGLTLVGKFIF